MPVINSSFSTETRLEAVSSGNYYSLVAKIHLGILAFIAVLGARLVFSYLYTRRARSLSAPSRPREFSWSKEEKSRGVSIGDTMSAPFSTQEESDEKGGMGSKGGDKQAEDGAIVGSESSERLAHLSSSATGQRPPNPLLVRPPPPPPLTLPQLSPTIFTFDERRRSFPHSVLPALDTTAFIHQPNPDYHGESSSTSFAAAGSSPEASTASITTPRRRSYTKTVAVGIPESSVQESEFSPGSFAPGSFPPTSPGLPPPAEFPETGHGTREIDLQGEIISAFDDAGHGWKRHTRVYGGGVCLACLQSGGEGGFYGANVRPEDRR